MIKIMIASHGPLAKALVETSSLILGSNSTIETMGLYGGDNPDDFKRNVAEKIKTLSKNNDLLIFTDLYGGTPSNAVMATLFDMKFPNNIVCYTGVNLPILLEGISLSENSKLEQVKDSLNDVMAESVINISDKFKNSL